MDRRLRVVDQDIDRAEGGQRGLVEAGDLGLDRDIGHHVDTGPVRATRSALRPLMTTRAPSAAKRVAIPRPMPWLEPVTTATLPASSTVHLLVVPHLPPPL
jgi:hypothetical protein